MKSAINLSEFNRLTASEKFSMLCEWGFFMFRKNKSGSTIALFSVHDFFAELEISKHDDSVINVKGHSFESMPIEYYQCIDLDSPFAAVHQPNTEIIQELFVAA